MHKLTSHLLLRLAAAALSFAVALVATSAWRRLTVFPTPGSSQTLIGVLSPAVITERMSPGGLMDKDSRFWILRRGQSTAEFDVNRPVDLQTFDENVIHTGCATLIVTLDEARKLKLNDEDTGSLDHPSELISTLSEFFRERELNRAYRPGMEYRSDIPTRERIEKTVLIMPSASLMYGDVLELVSILEQTGASPIVLQVGDGEQTSRHSSENYAL